MKIELIQHSDHYADSFMGDVRCVKRGRGWALAYRGVGGVWWFSGTGPKAEMLRLTEMAIPHAYPSLYA